MVAKILAIALAAMVGSMGLVQYANADFGIQEIWMSIANTKTGTVKLLKWQVGKHLFEENISIDLDHMMEKKIESIFGINQFKFTYQMNKYEETWHDFKVALGSKVHPGKPLLVTFTPMHGSERLPYTNVVKNTDAIDVGSIRAIINTDKQVYSEGERAILFIGFVDANDKFVNPDSMDVSFNILPFDRTLEKKKLGSYTYMTPPLESNDGHITLILQKEGHDIQTETIKITVLPMHLLGEHVT
ncbi:MAG: hypothetical protein ACRENW_06980 [Thermodesulfobacteriota bacterium]